jgi:organic hydroperoxide reductase OsmC/OhrA
MYSIESLGYPLAYKVTEGLHLSLDGIAVRVDARALAGMQKEALVHHGPSATVWRMVSDEGPYLNGTDLAPFPLAFFATGMALSFIEELLQHAAEAGISIRDYRLTQDNFYTMEGSAIRGDLIGGALPVEWHVQLDTDASQKAVEALVERAERASPAQAYMRQKLNNTFSLYRNRQQLGVAGVRHSPDEEIKPEPTPKLAESRPLRATAFAPDIITKLEAAQSVFGVEGGAGSSLQATQKRTLHVRAVVTPGKNGLKQVIVQLFKPLGSTFRFLADVDVGAGGENRAPSGLAYLAAGVGFCFMTQTSRYASILKHELRAYSIVQDSIFDRDGDLATARDVDTNLFLETGEPEAICQQILTMSERTCFLHAAMRSSNKTKIQVERVSAIIE